MIKFALGIFLSLAMLIGSASAGQETTDRTFYFFSPEEIVANYESPRIIRVGYFDQHGIYDGEGDNLTGYAVAMLSVISRYTGWEYEWVKIPFEDLEKRLNDGSIDLSCGVSYTPERGKNLTYSKILAGYENTSMHVKADSEAYYMDIASFDGMKIGFFHDSLQLSLMHNFARQMNFTFTPVLFEESEPMLRALQDGSIDAYVDGVLYGPGTKIVASLSMDPFFFVTKQNDVDIMPRINEAMKQQLLNLPTYQARLFDSYINMSQETPIAFRREEARWLRTKPVLKVAYSAKQDMMNPDKGSNFLYELFKMFERKSGIGFDYIEYPSYDACIDAVSTGKADVMTDISIAASLERSRDILIGKVYYTAPILIVQHLETSITNGSPDRRIVGFTEEMTSVRLSYEKAYPLDSIRVFPTARDCREAFRNNEIDAYVWPYPGGTLGEELPSGSTLLTTRAHYPMALGYSTRVSPYAVSVLDRVISSTPVSTFDTLRLSTARPSIWEEIITKISQHKLEIFGFLFVLGAVIAAWQWHKHRKYHAAIDKAAFTDSLTQGRNRTKFFLDAKTILKNNRGRFYIVYINIRELKIFNMIYGVKTGNSLVRFCCHEFNLRSGTNELVAYSGSGHYLILWRCDDDDNFARRIEDLFEVTRAAQKEYEKPLVFSCGVYILDEEERKKAEPQTSSKNMDPFGFCQ